MNKLLLLAYLICIANVKEVIIFIKNKVLVFLIMLHQ